jgi:hypothetical protein
MTDDQLARQAARIIVWTLTIVVCITIVVVAAAGLAWLWRAIIG